MSNDPKNLNAGADQILYGLANFGIIKPEYALMINYPDETFDENLKKAKKDIIDSLKLFLEEIELHGNILGQ